MTRRIVLIAALAAWLAGCATVPPEAGFPDVQQQVQARIGQRVRWNRGTPQDAQARALIEKLLSKQLTADNAVQIALLNNRGLQAVYENLGITQAAVVQAGLLNNPFLNGNVKPGLTGPGPEFELTITQNFMEILYLPLRKAVAESRFEAEKLHVTGAVIDHAAQTRDAFYRVQRDKQMIEMLRQIIAATNASYDAIKRLREAGNVRDLDVDNQRVLVEQARVELAATQAALATDRERLTVLMGLWGDDTRWTIAPRLPDPPQPAFDLTDLEKKAISNSIDLAAARHEIESFGHQLGLTHATALVPSFDFGAAGKREADGDYLLGPAFSLPLPLLDQGQARIAHAVAELRQKQKSYVALAVRIRSSVRAARVRLLTARRIAEHYRDEMLPLRERIVRETLLQYNAMQVGVFQLLIAKQQQISTGQRYIEALQDYWLARTDLETILQGRLSDVRRDVSSFIATMPGMNNN